MYDVQEIQITTYLCQFREVITDFGCVKPSTISGKAFIQWYGETF